MLRGPYYELAGSPYLLADLAGYRTPLAKLIKTLPEWMKTVNFLINGSPLSTSINRKSAIYNEFSIDELKQYLTVKNEVKDFGKLLTEKVVKAIEEVKDLDNIYLLWSGGIDSTCVLYAILDSENYNLIADRFSVLCTERIYYEYPEAYKDLSKRIPIKNVPISEFFKELSKLIAPTSIVFTGECGDQMASSLINYLFQEPIEKVCKIPWEDGLIQLRGKIPNFLPSLVELAPYKLKYITELGWFLNLLFKRDDVSTRIPFKLASMFNISVNDSNFYHIFCDDSFKDFSLSYHKNNEMTFGNRVKPFMKDFIYEHNKDRDYYENKRKFSSMAETTKIDRPINYIGYVDSQGDYRVEDVVKSTAHEIFIKINNYAKLL